jgi:glycolate oxidase
MLKPGIPDRIFQELQVLLGENGVSGAEEILEAYSHDYTEDLRFFPALVVFPVSTQEVSEVLKLCSRESIPVTPAGARTGLSGGALPVAGGIALSTSRMNQILEIDQRNLQVVTQPGVITQVLQDTVEELGLYYPPDPSSKGSCFIGGNVAESAGGIHAVKYGLTRDYVLSMEAVLMDGSVIRTGAKVLKNSTGYNLTQLLIGSEGTLAIVTEITLKLIPRPAYSLLLQVPFDSAFEACEAVSEIFRAGITPSALEFMERDAIRFGSAYLGMKDTLNEAVEAVLLIELDGSHQEVLYEEAERVARVVEKRGAGEILMATSREEQNQLFRVRRCLGEAVKGTTIYKEEDAVVPRAELARLLSKVKAIGKLYGFQSVCYGHAGDGNLHINIIKTLDLTDRQWQEEIPRAIREIFHYTVELGGTLSGEHGIGWVQKNYMDIAFSGRELELMRQIKQVFDPKGLLNPGKIFPDS